MFYRDNRFVGSGVFWGRGNGWAIGGLVAAIEHGATQRSTDPHRAEYVHFFRELAASLLPSQQSDGSWTPSLKDATAYPHGETTGTAGIVYGLAFGINSGILDASAFAAAVRSGWSWLSRVALQPSGRVGYCQPSGGSPENNFNASSTSAYCIGDFLLAASEVAVLRH